MNEPNLQEIEATVIDWLPKSLKGCAFLSKEKLPGVALNSTGAFNLVIRPTTPQYERGETKELPRVNVVIETVNGGLPTQFFDTMANKAMSNVDRVLGAASDLLDFCLIRGWSGWTIKTD